MISTTSSASGCPQVTTVDDLIPWLRAQLDDDERIAREAEGPGYFYAEGHSDNVWAFLERWCPDNPKFVLDDIEAKRRILDLHMPAAPGYSCPTCWEGAEGGGPLGAPCPTVRLLALPYADRSGFREEWRP